LPILGITDGQTSGAAVVADARVRSAINEERIVRIKMARGFPRKSIAEALRLAGLTAKDLTGVAVAPTPAVRGRCTSITTATATAAATRPANTISISVSSHGAQGAGLNTQFC